MQRPSDEITRLAEQCKPDRSFPPGMSKKDAVSILRYIEWIEDERQRYLNANQNDDYDTSFSSVPV